MQNSWKDGAAGQYDTLADLPREARELLVERCITQYDDKDRRGTHALFESLTKQGILRLRMHVKGGLDEKDESTSQPLPSPSVSSVSTSPPFSFMQVLTLSGIEHLDISFSSPHRSIIEMFASLSPPLPTRPLHSPIVHSITSLNLSHCENVTDGVIDIISKQFLRLEHLNISACGITEEGMLYISTPSDGVKSMLRLRSLDVSHNLSSAEAVHSLKAMTTLTSLNISCLRNVFSMEDYTDLIWSNLETFRMGGLVCLESNDIARTIASSIHTLKVLELGECSLDSAHLDHALATAFHMKNEDESELQTVADLEASCTSLELLNLSWCEDVSSGSIFSLLCKSPNIRTLILQKSGILSEHVSLIANYCPLIEELNVALCSGKCVSYIIIHYIYLLNHSLFYTPTTDISNAAISSLSHLSHLQVINIAWSLVKDEGVLWLLKYCPIRILILQGCKELTEVLVERIIESKSNKKMNLDLVDLTMVDCCEATLAKRLSAILHDKCVVVDYYQSSYKKGRLVQEYYTGNSDVDTDMDGEIEVDQGISTLANVDTNPEVEDAYRDIIMPTTVDASAEFPKLGIKCFAFSEFVDKIGKHNVEGLTTTEVCDNYVKPFTLGKGSMCDYLKCSNSENVGVASVFISHAWKYIFLDVVSALERHFAATPDTIIWFDLFSNDQNNAPNLDFHWWSTTFKTAIADLGRVVMVLAPWKEPIPFTRGWCLYEVYCAIETGATFEVALSKEEEQGMIQTVCSHTTFFIKIMTRINVEKSDCWNKDDLARILEVVRTKVPGGVVTINDMVRGKLRDWLCGTIEASALSFESLNLHASTARWFAAADFRRQMGDCDTAKLILDKILLIDRGELLAAEHSSYNFLSAQTLVGETYRQLAFIYRDFYRDYKKCIEVCEEGLFDNPQNVHWAHRHSGSDSPPPVAAFNESMLYCIIGSVSELRGDIPGSLPWYEVGNPSLYRTLSKVVAGELQYDEPNFVGMFRHFDYEDDTKCTTDFRFSQ